MLARELGRDVAQQIADAIMQIVPYNINIMDTRGYIIASGDAARLNTLHLGAVHALERMEPVEVAADAETERMGVNFPIISDGQVLGVIGVSGDPQEVTHIGKIVVAMARMMIETQAMSDIAAVREGRLRDFLSDWVYLKADGYKEEFLARARDFGIDVAVPRAAAIITSRRVRFSVFDQVKRWLEPGEYVVRQGAEDVLMLFNPGAGLMQRVGRIMGLNKDLRCCYLGEPARVVSDSVAQALKAFRTAHILGLEGPVVTWREIALEHALGALEAPDEVLELAGSLRRSEYCRELVDTIVMYVRCGHDHAEICRRMHIHRNTLGYRLGRIEEITGKSPRSMRDLMELYIAVLHIKAADAAPTADPHFGSFF